MKTIPSKVFASPLFHTLLILAAVALPCTEMFAQQSPVVQPEPYQVGTITVRFVGVANISEQLVRANMQLREGSILDEAVIDRDIRSLYRTGQFEFIEVKRELAEGRTVNFVIEVTPKYRVLDVRYSGNERVRDKRLEREIKTTRNDPLDERIVKEDSEAIFKYYQKRGFSQAEVTYSIDRDRTTGYGTVIFQIREGPRVRIKDVEFTGNESISSRRLRKQMDTRDWWLLSWLTGSGRFKDDVFEDDLDKLRDFYREEGFLDVEIRTDEVTFEYPSEDRMVITIPVREGRRYRIGEVEITGSSLYSEATLRSILRLGPGDVFAPSRLDEEQQRLQDFYGQDGYLETRVGLIRKPNIATGNIDVEYAVEESEKYFVESIQIDGNTKTKSIVILREINLAPGDVFNTERMKSSKMRLENTQFFEEVNLTPEPTNLPGRRNLKISMREARTGNLTFGAGFSSLESAVVFAEIQQGNFDLFNRRSWFQGDGQKFRLRLQVGSESSDIILSFQEPWLFERELGFGFELFRTTSDYVSAFFSEERAGGEVFLSKLFVPFPISGRLFYRYETVDLEITDQSLSEEVRNLITEAAGDVSKVGFALEQYTLDSLITPTRGNKLEFRAEVAGSYLGGDYDYYRLEANGTQHFPLFETQTQVLSITGRAGIVNNYGDSSSVPFFDRLFLGGPSDLRGFEFREVGPKDASGEPIGGKTYGLLQVEYSMDIVSPIRFAIFYDAGFVNRNAYDFNPSGYNDNIGLGIRLFLAGAPIRLDYAIPLTTDRFNDEGGQFNFSLANPF